MPSDKELDVRILGQLMLMQSIVASLPDDAVIPFVTKGLSDIPGVSDVEFYSEASSEENALNTSH